MTDQDRITALEAEVAQLKDDLEAECAANVLFVAQVTTLTEQRDLCAAEAERMRAALDSAMHLLDDVDQGPRSENSKEWRIPWSRFAVEVFSVIANIQSKPSTAAQVLSERDERVRAEVAGAIPLAVAAALESERNGEFAERRALEARLAEVTAADRATRIALVEVETALIEVEAALAASQAHAVELKRVLADMKLLSLARDDDIPTDWNDIQKRADELLARESSTDALREFGRKCVVTARLEPTRPDVQCVDAVLRVDHE